MLYEIQMRVCIKLVGSFMEWATNSVMLVLVKCLLGSYILASLTQIIGTVWSCLVFKASVILLMAMATSPSHQYKAVTLPD